MTTSTHTSMSVIWSAVLSVDSDHVFARREETTVRRRDVFANNAETIAAEVIRDWLEDGDAGGFDNWNEIFGSDEITADGIVVVIHEPGEIAGRYSVDCERVLKARARRLDEKESAALDAMLAREDVL